MAAAPLAIVHVFLRDAPATTDILLAPPCISAAASSVFICNALYSPERERIPAWLTGESVAVLKGTEPLPASEEAAELQAKENMLFSGTAISNGTAMAVVTATGMGTEMGKIQSQIKVHCMVLIFECDCFCILLLFTVELASSFTIDWAIYRIVHQSHWASPNWGISRRDV
jgi:hypothetical protein